MFQVKVEKVLGRYAKGMKIGVAVYRGSGMSIPSVATSMKTDNWIWSGKMFLHNGEMIKKTETNLHTVQVVHVLIYHALK